MNKNFCAIKLIIYSATKYETCYCFVDQFFYVIFRKTRVALIILKIFKYQGRSSTKNSNPQYYIQ